MQSKTPSYVTLHLPTVRECSVVKMNTPQDTYRVLADTANLAQEMFTVCTLNTKYNLINRHTVSLGLANATLVHSREVFRPAITDGASMVILSHNHPTGDATPSAEDVMLTKNLVEAGRLLDIQVLDHMIIGRGERPYLSMRESGLVSFGKL